MNRNSLISYEANVLGIVYNGLVHNLGKIKTLQNASRELKSLVKATNLDKKYQKTLWSATVRTYFDAYRKSYKALLDVKKRSDGISYQESMEKRSTAVFEALNSNIDGSESLARACNEVFRDVSNQESLDKVDKLLAKKSVFYVCTYHEGCAKDHAMYQGRVYFDERWKDFVTSRADQDKIYAYIRNHRLLSAQSVIKSGPYLMLRPNCTHELVAVPTSEVLTSSVNRILEKHSLIRKATRHFSPQVKAYSNALTRYKAMYNVMPNQKLAKRIKETKHLITKWTKLAH